MPESFLIPHLIRELSNYGGWGGGAVKWENRESKTFLAHLFVGVKLHYFAPSTSP